MALRKKEALLALARGRSWQRAHEALQRLLQEHLDELLLRDYLSLIRSFGRRSDWQSSIQVPWEERPLPCLGSASSARWRNPRPWASQLPSPAAELPRNGSHLSHAAAGVGGWWVTAA
eukprot:Skav229318  [mRNA]  locus=scaffold2616:104563:106920:+ [translate_table: standard]